MVETSPVRVLGVVLLLTVTSIGCGAGGGNYDEEIRNNFLVDCQYEYVRAAGSGSAAEASDYCVRALSCVEGKLSQDEFLYEENLMLLTDELSDRLADVMARCLSA